MSVYNIVHGYNPLASLAISILGFESKDIPRFRDAFIGRITKGAPVMGVPRNDSDNDPSIITIYTRTGGGNRPYNEEAHEELKKHSQYFSDRDDEFDNTFAFWEFKTPEKNIKFLTSLIDLLKTND